jgi:nucleotide-binding universal stress UspA family protein
MSVEPPPQVPFPEVPFADALLQLDAYPETSSAALVGQAVAVAAGLARSVCAILDEPCFEVAVNPVAERLAGVRAVEHEQARRAHAAVEAVSASFAAAADGLGLAASVRVEHRPFGLDFGQRVAEAARGFDLCLIPYVDPLDGQRCVAEAVVFGSGRPVLLWQAGAAAPRLAGSIAIAWDGGRGAARAVADALPLLKRAETVTALTVTGGERPPPHAGAAALIEHLARHGVRAVAETLQAQRGSADERLVEAAGRHDLLVMGAFRRSPASQMVLGGMTKRVLDAPRTPVFLSH